MGKLVMKVVACLAQLHTPKLEEVQVYQATGLSTVYITLLRIYVQAQPLVDFTQLGCYH